jgi:hypothetical protein
MSTQDSLGHESELSCQGKKGGPEHPFTGDHSGDLLKNLGSTRRSNRDGEFGEVENEPDKGQGLRSWGALRKFVPETKRCQKGNEKCLGSICENFGLGQGEKIVHVHDSIVAVKRTITLDDGG